MLGFQFSVKSNVFALFCFTVLLGWLENLRHVLKLNTKNQAWLAQMCFPVFYTTYVYLLWFLIGSQDFETCNLNVTFGRDGFRQVVFGIFLPSSVRSLAHVLNFFY